MPTRRAVPAIKSSGSKEEYGVIQPPSKTFILKIAGACNLNCTYCYMYNMGDTTFRSRPRIMSREVATAMLHRVYEYVSHHKLEFVALGLHGGEPLLVGKPWLRWFLDEARRLAPPDTHVEIGLQSNGTLLDREWLALLSDYQVQFGISIDGPPEINDRYRVTFSGRGTYNSVRSAIDLLVEAGSSAPHWGVLVVADPQYSGITVYEHLLEIGVKSMDFLWPDYHHDLPRRWPSGSLGRYYIDLFEAWYGARDTRISIRWFETVMRSLLGDKPQLDALGPRALSEVVIETDGSLEPLDVLRTCGNGMTNLGLNVLSDSIDAVRATQLFQLGLRNQEILADECRICPVYKICGGGYLPHRWGRKRGFRNVSVHCADLFAVITHIARSIQNELDLVSRQLPAL